MFRRFAGEIPEGASNLFRCHPLELSTLLEVAWQGRIPGAAGDELGTPAHRSHIKPLPDFWLGPLRHEAGIEPPASVGGRSQDLSGTVFERALATSEQATVFWDHLIYAYMIENTRIYEIFRRVLHEFLHGEKFGVPLPDAEHWLRNTEELFYRDPPPFSITTITSHVRPDLRATRRNAYWRMFGMDLNHGTDDGQPYAYVKADAYNNEFVTVFEELLREAWVAITNVNNQTGPNPTDEGKISNLVENLRNMLVTRRKGGNLSREEFVLVSMMSWFDLTMQADFPIIQSLRAEGASPEQRLFKIAQRVGLPAHGLSKSYFDIADPMSRILIQIELLGASETGIVPALVARGGSSELNDIQKTVNTIITHWSIITGHDVKAGKVAVR